MIGLLQRLKNKDQKKYGGSVGEADYYNFIKVYDGEEYKLVAFTDKVLTAGELLATNQQGDYDNQEHPVNLGFTAKLKLLFK